MAPDLLWRVVGGRAEVNRNALAAPHAFVPEDRPALDSLRAMIAECQMALPPGVPPMCGGLFGFLGYDMVRLMERLPAKNADVLGLPDALMLRPTLFAVFDTVTDELDPRRPCPPRARRPRGAGLGPRHRPASPTRRPPSPAPCPAPPRPWRCRRPSRCRTWTAPRSRRWWCGCRSTSSPGTSSRRCPRSGSPPRSRCRRLRCIARCGGSTRRRSCSSWISAASRSWAAARRSWSACATTP